MHVLIIPSWYFPRDSKEIGGKNFHQLAIGLRETGIDARIFYGHYSPFAPPLKKRSFTMEEMVPTMRESQFTLPKVHSSLIKNWINKYAAGVEQYIREHGKPNLIHAQSYLASMVAREIKQRTGIPFIYTEHLSAFITGSIPGLYIDFIKKGAESANLVTSVSPGLKEKMLPYTSSAIEIIPNFYDLRIFFYDGSVPKNETFTWVTVGEPAYIKGLDLLIQAFGLVRKLLPDVKMQLILVDEIKEKEALLKLAAEKNIQDSLVWTGLIDQKQIADIFRKSHAYVSASRAETFGTSIVEAQACGLPVIATQTDGAQYILNESGQGTLTELGNLDQMANAMRDVYLAYAQYNPHNIMKLVEARFSKEVVINQWKEIYSRVAL
ncbi:MAG: glycosyltransferase [Saprospiraceae bacterium]